MSHDEIVTNDLEVKVHDSDLFLCLSASVFLASAPPRVGESLHFRKHCQQRLGSRHHNSIRWGVQTQTVVFPSSHPSAQPVNPVTFGLFQAENVKSNQFHANLHLPFCLRNNFPTKQCWFGLLLEIIGITSVAPSLYSGVVGAELTSTNVSIFITSDAGNTWREVTAALSCDITMWLHHVVPSVCHPVSEMINIFLPLNVSLHLRQRDGNKKAFILKKSERLGEQK